MKQNKKYTKFIVNYLKSHHFIRLLVQGGNHKAEASSTEELLEFVKLIKTVHFA